MTSYAERPWLARYGVGRPADITPEFTTMLDLFRASAARSPDVELIRYFDGVLTTADVDRASDALAVALLERGFRRGDRLALYLQNDPAFVIGLIAAWKAGGKAVAINPMNKHRELTYLLEDSGATALLCLDDLYADVARPVIASGQTVVRLVITASALDFQQRLDPRLFGSVLKPVVEDALDLTDLLDRHAGQVPPPVHPNPDEVAILTYTSGTTGVPKGAMNTHRTMAFNCQTYRDWMALTGNDSVLGVAPLFHITGLVGHVGLALLLPCPLVLAHRFHPAVVLDAIREHRPTFMIGAITVFIALADVPDATPDDFASLKVVYSGGAPIAPAVRDRIKAQTGLNIHNIYGLTETNSPSHGVPLGADAPVDPASGALSIGVPVFNTLARIAGEDGEDVPVGEIGEIAITGPQVVPGYWNKPDATAESLPGGELCTGDVGFMDADGWFYLVDRKKDMINAAGYKVWPREVEDVLYTHPAVREAAVVGVPDPYRGENVAAYVSLLPGARVTPEELIAFCRANMAAYKYPRTVTLVEDLPKTTTGKILRRELRGR
ncbi:class I adenylate-forming enzyme family protein [Cryptosporangium phraense]|uniref:Long-chain fatty acid--CoA ligase n=1 Tax=Cryptosporangium phraense TaxID=2593070 RepID=A0A545B0D5_9ACTN|nr:AMP-binding protein [Cryptosporangium phraense]TQS47047.1 long-chain fatty acid--CoA ligase [Cryptosporangium phraense]